MHKFLALKIRLINNINKCLKFVNTLSAYDSNNYILFINQFVSPYFYVLKSKSHNDLVKQIDIPMSSSRTSY